MWTVHLLVLAAVVTLSAAEPRYYELSESAVYFGEFLVKYDKKYPTEEEKARRYEIFKENLKEANRLNMEANIDSYGITMFSDLTKEEFNKKYNGLNLGSTSNIRCSIPGLRDFGLRAPENFDWRDSGVVTPVKNQGRCGSCWAFSTIGNIESQYAIKYRQLRTFSEQQLVDCDSSSNGCFSGTMVGAMRTLIELGGVESESDYPYEDRNDTCRFDASRIIAKVTSYRNIGVQDEEALKEELYRTGPLCIAVDSGAFHIHERNIVTDCSGRHIGHAVLLVGYGEEGSTPYWIIKNSWGMQAGDEGYYKIARGVNCLGLINDNMVTAIVG